MSKSMYGYVDRTAPVGNSEATHVRTVINRMIRDCGTTEKFKTISEAEAQAIEVSAFKSAIDKLDPEYQKYIKNTIKSTDASATRKQVIKIRNFGEVAMTELLAKLGIFINTNIPDDTVIR